MLRSSTARPARLALNAPIVGIAPAGNGAGYWIVGSDGGVFSFGAAPFLGSLGGSRLQAPILAIEPTPSGNGYWLIAADGGVFSFGDASFYGSTAGLDLPKPIVAAASTPTGAGYWLMSSDGAVFAFGDAAFQGSAIDAAAPPAVEISADGTGYRVARENGAVAAFGVADLGGIPDPAPGAQPVVGLATRFGGGYWLAQGERAVAVAAPDISGHPFLVCTRAHESGAAGYRAVNPSGTYRGAYQFSRSTWDSTARHAGRLDLVGVDPAAAAPADQDALALHLYQWQGASPWLGRCSGR